MQKLFFTGRREREWTSLSRLHLGFVPRTAVFSLGRTSRGSLRFFGENRLVIMPSHSYPAAFLFLPPFSSPRTRATAAYYRRPRHARSASFTFANTPSAQLVRVALCAASNAEGHKYLRDFSLVGDFLKNRSTLQTNWRLFTS